MRKLFLILTAITWLGNASAEDWKVFSGAWFDVSYPPTFSVKPGLKSSTSAEGVDTAWFASPDGSVELYVCSPQWWMKPTDFMSEAEYKEAVPEIDEDSESIDDHSTLKNWWWTSKEGSPIRSINIQRQYDAQWAIGVKYTNQEAYDKYKKDYLKFKKSLKQYAD
jgi:hypothetical protein